MPAIELIQTTGREWYRGNLHLHSDRSDGAAPVETVLATYRDAGYDFVALTDHYEAEYSWSIVDTTPFRTQEFTTLLGAEFSTGDWDARDTVWVNAIGLPPGWSATKPEDHLAALRGAKAAGAWLMLPHPGLNGQPPATVLNSGLAGILDAVEIYNHNMATGGLSDAVFGTYMIEALFEAGVRTTITAGDDAHFEHPLDRFGGWVMVASQDRSPELLLENLKAGNFFATQGPEIHGLRRDGDLLTVESSPVYNIVVAGCGDRWHQTRSTVVERSEDTIMSAAVDLSPFRESWARVILVDHHLRRAWSNPIWV